MCSLSTSKKARKKLIANSRGFSSIVGAVFAVLVMISLMSTVFVWSLSENTSYNNTVTQTRQADLDRSNEKIVANVTCTRVDNNLVAVNGNLSNNGPLSVQIVTLWVVDYDTTTYSNKSLSITLQPGNITFLPSPKYNVPLPNLQGDIYNFWFITARGNLISVNPIFAASTASTAPPYFNANVTQGIGSVSMDFNKFNHYEFSSSPDGYDLNSYTVTNKNYTLTAKKFLVLHIVLTDLDPDPSQPNIMLNGLTALYFLGATSSGQSSSVKWGYWKSLNVTSDRIVHLGWNVQYSLIWGQPTDIYFYASGGQNGDSDWPNGLYPMNIMVFGTKGNNDYGQNIPFVSVYMTT